MQDVRVPFREEEAERKVCCKVGSKEERLEVKGLTLRELVRERIRFFELHAQVELDEHDLCLSHQNKRRANGALALFVKYHALLSWYYAMLEDLEFDCSFECQVGPVMCVSKEFV